MQIGGIESALDADSGTDEVHSRVRVVGVAVRVMRGVDTGPQIPTVVHVPVQVQPEVEVGVHFRPYHIVEDVLVAVVRFPAEGGAEVPFVVE